MKSPNALLSSPISATIRAAVAVTAVATLLAGCGQTGPLYMPAPPAKPAPAPATTSLTSSPLSTPAVTRASSPAPAAQGAASSASSAPAK